MDRKQCEDYKSVIKETVKLLIEKKDMPISVASYGIDPVHKAVAIVIEDDGVSRWLARHYDVVPQSMANAHELKISLPFAYYEHDVDAIDVILGIDIRLSHDVKLRCRIGKQIWDDWSRWRDLNWPDAKKTR